MESGEQKVKVYFDQSPLVSGHAVRGIGSYTRNLIQALYNKEVEIVDNQTSAEVVHITDFPLFNNTSLSFDIPLVVTIYDVIPLLYPRNYPLGVRAKIALFRQKRNLKKASAIITISKTSKKDIAKYLNTPLDKIYPIYLAPSPAFHKLETGDWKLETTKRYSLPKRFVLYVGDINYNKNLLNLARACKKINAKLVVVGKQAVEDPGTNTHPELAPFREFMKEFGQDSNVLRLGFVEEEDLVKIYNLASVYCQPSLYEGFGLPILEAMACGLPVVSSNTPALKEVGGECVRYVNPDDSSDIAKGLLEILQNEDFAKKLRDQGLKRVKNYSWQKVASETIEVYKHVSKK